ncbi:flagellar protein FlaG [Ruminiclostridium sufflavum DSM 19573]|uniref:Flagellar protein FlaG n=1 Tax=Ruminiclostridium sufflavum DSM 19573 TaxID=1121337 RepID=A0A318XND6_9FIRM|nr:flagellar protein FlaG [Ruminiclostridium sufflavum]PYG89126.1 flagellar protein FlaG [Ruminiclostridium sufflavum DSM 19573]
MKIEKNDSISANVNINSNNANNISAIKRASTGNINNTNTSVRTDKDWSLANGKSISQLNEYDMESMPISERVVIEAIEKANKAIQGGNRKFEFSIHEETNQIMVKVYDSDTNELIKEIPNEKILDMVAKICEMAGILVDERR